MALVDDPKAFILRMFAMEVREGRGEYCQIFPEGRTSEALALDGVDLIYGIYKSKYYFSTNAITVAHPTGYQRIVWSEVASCSTKHGDGNTQAKLTTVGGDVMSIEFRDIVKGHSGRISQLFHGMIERWGTPGSLGHPLLSIEQFLSQAHNDYAFAPNLEPHPSLDEIREQLLALSRNPQVDRVLLSKAGAANEELTVDRVVIVSRDLASQFEHFASQLRASGIVEASSNTRRKVGALQPGVNVWEVLWD